MALDSEGIRVKRCFGAALTTAVDGLIGVQEQKRNPTAYLLTFFVRRAWRTAGSISPSSEMRES